VTTRKTVYVRRTVKLLGSSLFFRIIVVLFVLQAAWIALSGRYPMAFDEDYHLGIIRLYAHHVSPFWSSQPPGADQFGAVFRDPSYLYHYLMSFPYRLISLATSNQSAQVLFLRGINIALAAASLPLYGRLLLKTGASRALVHLCMAIFVLLPITPLLAAQINYDNLLLPYAALTLLLALRYGESPGVRRLLVLLTLCLLGGLIKFAFLPIAGAVFVYAAWVAWQQGLGRFKLKSKLNWLLIVIVLVSGLLFSERYVLNVARYGSPVPNCDKVLNVQRCQAYGPWLRDNQLKQLKSDQASDNPLVFGYHWFTGMWMRTFFAVDGPASNFATRGPLLVPSLSAAFFGVAGLVAAVIKWREILRRYNRPALWLSAAVSGLYIITLVLQEFKAFVATDHAVAINGRYLMLVYPLLFILGGLGVSELLKRRPDVRAGLAAAAIFCLVWGGGALTYVLRSSDSWYWNSQPVRTANHAVQRVLGPVTPGYNDPNDFLGFN
jgi:hypothetical protein